MFTFQHQCCLKWLCISESVYCTVYARGLSCKSRWWSVLDNPMDHVAWEWAPAFEEGHESVAKGKKQKIVWKCKKVFDTPFTKLFSVLLNIKSLLSCEHSLWADLECDPYHFDGQCIFHEDQLKGKGFFIYHVMWHTSNFFKVPTLGLSLPLCHMFYMHVTMLANRVNIYRIWPDALMWYILGNVTVLRRAKYHSSQRKLKIQNLKIRL